MISREALAWKKVIDILQDYEYHVSVMDKVWEIIFPTYRSKYKKEWLKVKIIKYEKGYYIQIDKKHFGLQIRENVTYAHSRSEERSESDLNIGWVEAQEKWCEDLIQWLEMAKNNWLSTYRRTYIGYPKKFRKGIISAKVVKESGALNYLIAPGSGAFDYWVKNELSREEIEQFKSIYEDGYGFKGIEFLDPTPSQYFEYCKIAYRASQTKYEEPIDINLTGKELYQKYADGRDEGLCELELHNVNAFEEWLVKPKFGGHPWEIKRGGNSTHIDLTVVCMKMSDGKKVSTLELNIDSTTRLAEAIKMFLALYDAGAPIVFRNLDRAYHQLTYDYNLGIIPEYETLHRASQQFPEGCRVYDCIYFAQLKGKNILPFINWDILPVLPKYKG